MAQVVYRVYLVLGLLLSLAVICRGQPVGRFVLGRGVNTWQSGGKGREPTVLVKRRGQVREDTTNAPGEGIDFDHRPGWISPRFFSEDENIAGQVQEGEGTIRTLNTFYGVETAAQLDGTVNGDHLVAFERKPTPLNPEVKMRDVGVILDFARPVGIHRIRFYPRNTVVETPSRPFHDDFLRAYEIWINPTETHISAPDLLVARDTRNEEPIVNLSIPPQYVRLVKLKSLIERPFEIDEIEVYGTGYLNQATYLSDIIDLEDRTTIGPIHWVENAVGDLLFSHLYARVRTGNDETPVLYREKVRDSWGRPVGAREVSPVYYYRLDPSDRVALEEDIRNWSQWSTVEDGGLIAAPVPRRFIQLRFEFEGELVHAREVDQLAFDYLQPPIADTLWAEVYPRLAEAEKPATFRYAVRLRATGPVRGYDRLEVDTNAPVENIRALRIDGAPAEFAVDFIRPEMFSLRLPLIETDGALLEFTFDLPIFRFGTTFSGRVYHRGSGAVPQRLQPGNAVVFAPDDVDELSTLFVAIPRRQIGKLVGEIVLNGRVLTPNGDGVNEGFELFFNLLQLVGPAPVALEIYDLAGRRVHQVFKEERGIGPASRTWDGRGSRGQLVRPGIYLWVLRVEADAFEERHSGTLAVIY